MPPVCFRNQTVSSAKCFSRIARNLPQDLTSGGHRNLHRYFVAILVFSFREVEYRNDRGDNDEKCCLCKFTSGTDPLSNPNARAILGSSRKLPSLLRNRSGLNSSGSGYISGSCRTALKPSDEGPDRNRSIADVPCVGYYRGSC